MPLHLSERVQSTTHSIWVNLTHPALSKKPTTQSPNQARVTVLVVTPGEVGEPPGGGTESFSGPSNNPFLNLGDSYTDVFTL